MTSVIHSDHQVDDISFTLHVLKNEYLESKTRYCETKIVLMVYF